MKNNSKIILREYILILEIFFAIHTIIFYKELCLKIKKL